MDRSLTGRAGPTDRVPTQAGPLDDPAEIGVTEAVSEAEPSTGDSLAQIRRSPYGRNPTLAAHGVRARAEIVEAARELFARNGYQATTVEKIGEATGRSGAAVYQYFEGKAEILKIFLLESGVKLESLGERFPLLTDDDAGRDALRAWIAELIEVLDAHQSNFLMWSSIQFSEPVLTEIGRRNLAVYQHGVAARLAEAGAHPPTPAVVPIGILSVVQWTFFLSLTRSSPIARQRLEEALAGVLQSYLLAPSGSTEIAGNQAVPDDEMPRIPLGDAMGLRRPVTARGVGTVQRILIAAADRFRTSGFLGTSLSDVAAAAGVSHASVYTYWADRDALFTTLARDALNSVRVRVQALPEALQTDGGLTGWIESWVTMLSAHGAVLYVWTHEVDAPQLADLTGQMHELVDRAGTLLIEASGQAGVDDREALSVVLRAVLTDVPYALSVQLGILPRDATCAFVAGLLAAGLGTGGARNDRP